MIFGPFSKSGIAWQPEQVDDCNGMFMQGQYFYVTSFFYPYKVSCWGPGTFHNNQRACTANPINAASTDVQYIDSVSNALFLSITQGLIVAAFSLIALY